MASTYEKIATTTLGSATASVTFSSISGSYTDLVLVVNGKTTGSGGNNYLLLRVNSDSSTNYSRTGMYGDGSTAGSFRNTNSANGYLTIGQAVDSFGNAIVNFQNYSNTTTYKTFLSRENYPSGAVYASVMLWRSTSAITSISLLGDGFNIASGSTFTIYGILKA